MKIRRIDDLHADFGWRSISFLRVEASDGTIGWSEYTDGPGSSNSGVTAIIRALAERLIGEDPRRLEAIAAKLGNWTIQALGGVNQQAIAAIVNALIDIKAKLLGVPVCDLLGGALRRRIPLYWSHCGSYRARYPKELGLAAPRSYDDLAAIGAEASKRGFSALKTNILLPSDDGLQAYRPSRGGSGGFPELNCSKAVLDGLAAQLAALHEGAGPDTEILLDVNFHFKAEGFLRIARSLADAGLGWLELDSHDPKLLSLMRTTATMPIASCENIYGRRGFRPFLEAQTVDVAIVDVIWNGYLESLKIAAMAESHDVNVAPHNYFGHLADFVSAHFAAASPNLRIMEMDVDGVPWRHEFYSHVPEVVDGHMLLADRPGWGTEINEEAVRKRPPRQG